MAALVVLLAVCGLVSPGGSPRAEEARWGRLATSPDGYTTLERRIGEGGPELRVRRGVRERWRRSLVVEPEHVHVTDEAQVVLVGTRAGSRHERGRRQNYLVVAILDSWGQLLQYQHVMQYRGRPRALGLVVDRRQELVAVRLGGRLGVDQKLWLYGLASGEILDMLCPRDVVRPEVEGSLRLRDVRFVNRRGVIATLWSTGVCSGSSAAGPGDTVALIGLRSGLLHVVSLPYIVFADRPCGWFAESAGNELSLTMLDGSSVAFEIAGEGLEARLEPR